MARTGLGKKAAKLTASIGAAAMVFALGYAVHTTHSPSHNGRTIQVASAFKTRQAEKALVAILRNSKPTLALVGKSGRGPTQTRIPVGHVRTSSTKNATLSNSVNWSGYASAVNTKQEYSKVSASWKIPAAICTSEQRLSSVWVGLDGFQTTSNTLEQAGTTSFCFEGTAFYFTWYEMFPAAAVEIGTTAAAGDQISTSVTRSGTSYTLSLTDSTTANQGFSKTFTCALTKCLDNSAEWVIERPAYNIGIVPLAHTGTVFLGGGTTVAAGKTYNIASAPSLQQMNMVDATDSYNLDTTSTATTGSFSVAWNNSY
jgi:hypothetical protein